MGKLQFGQQAEWNKHIWLGFCIDDEERGVLWDLQNINVQFGLPQPQRPAAEVCQDHSGTTQQQQQ